MTNDELRALADALHWVQYTADWQACDQAADYLRAQADAQPVAPQAEPKREPLSDEQLVFAYYTYRHALGLLDPDE